MIRVHSLSLLDTEAEPMFVKDLGNGEVQVQCSRCKSLTSEERCPNCHCFFVYRPWWSW